MNLKLEHHETHEDGSATYTFDMDKGLEKLCGEYGLKLLLFCGVLGKSPDTVLRELEREVETAVALSDLAKADQEDDLI